MLARRTFFRYSLGLFCVLAIASLGSTALAQAPDTAGLEAVGAAGGLAGGGTDLITIIGRIINVVLGFVGIILLVMLLYAGYLWMTSGGEADKVTTAQTMIRNAIIGLIIITSAFAITQFILNALLGATGGGGRASGDRGAAGRGSGFPSAAGSLGGGIIESHVPDRGANDVPRNTAIVITFKEPIKLSSFIKDYNDYGTPADLSDDRDASSTIGLNGDVIKIFPTGSRDQALTSLQARVRFTSDRQTFVIRPIEPLGSPTAEVPYTVEILSGRTGLLREDGTQAFTGISSSGYSWPFEVSTVIDNTPPKMTSVIPADGGRFAPNIIVQMNFNEPIDPTTASGLVTGGSGFTNIEVRATRLADETLSRPNGEFKVSNRYRTVEFVTDLSCGTNSCGRTVYCLPAESSIAVIAKAASLSDTPPLALFTASGVDGITDMAGNSLDGNGNNAAEGRDLDDYGWTFATLAEPNLDAPRIRETLPIAGDFDSSSNIPVDQEPQATFDTIMQSSTVNSDNVIIRTSEPTELADTFWWTTGQEVLTSAGAVAGPGDETVYGRVSMSHRPYLSATTSSSPIYQPVLFSGLQNVYQNCYNPASSESCTGSPHCCDAVPDSTDAGCRAPSITP